ncbi:MAG: P-loop containing nucleoside triphosphate hydrolase protein [Piptocephalis tieghemiana]|nr:MAG: P-loop containing nucleoside triphosphate hydrolase protein [Piptocephalis tieghemiana]
MDNNKPVFLSKAKRARLALERREKEAEQQRQRLEEERAKRKIFDEKASQAAEEGSHPRSDQQETPRYGQGSNDSMDKNDIPVNDAEIQAIKNRYMGTEERRRRIRKVNDRKFVFDWDAAEDTSRDLNPLYAERHDAQLFGRGHFAGIDVNEQRQQRGQFYEDLRRRRQTESDRERVLELEKREEERERKRKFDDRHWTEKPLSEMRDRDWRIFKEDFSISCKGGQIPHPLRSWEESSLPSSIISVIADIGYKEPSPIQRQAIPIGLQNRDIIGIAETGSGKTASFVIPMLVYISALPPMVGERATAGPYALILAPTRELALQIDVETQKFASRLNLRCVSIVGGHDLGAQMFKLRDGAEIIIATPGRLKDCLEQHVLVLSQCSYVVMDEADRMIDMGFEESVNFILDALPASNVKPEEEAEGEMKMEGPYGGTRTYRQTVMFSATMPPAVERLAHRYLRKPAVVTIGVAGQAVDTVVQQVEIIGDEGKKRNRLVSILQSEQYKPPIIVFVNQKKGVDALARALVKLGHRTTSLHGGKNQEQREASLAQLKKGEVDVLVATDVAGRGLDVKDVSLVINFDMAKNIEDYTHRIGRTGRAGKTGTAITFLNPSLDADVMYDLRQMISKSPVSKVPPELARHEAAHTRSLTTTKRKLED